MGGEVEAKKRGEGAVGGDAEVDLGDVVVGVGEGGGGEIGDAADGSVTGEVELADKSEAGLIQTAGDALAPVIGVDGDVHTEEGGAGRRVVLQEIVTDDGVVVGGEPMLIGEDHVGAAGDDLAVVGGDELALGEQSEVVGEMVRLPEEFVGERRGEADALEGSRRDDVFGLEGPNLDHLGV